MNDALYDGTWRLYTPQTTMLYNMPYIPVCILHTITCYISFIYNATYQIVYQSMYLVTYLIIYTAIYQATPLSSLLPLYIPITMHAVYIYHNILPHQISVHIIYLDAYHVVHLPHIPYHIMTNIPSKPPRYIPFLMYNRLIIHDILRQNTPVMHLGIHNGVHQAI